MKSQNCPVFPSFYWYNPNSEKLTSLRYFYDFAPIYIYITFSDFPLATVGHYCVSLLSTLFNWYYILLPQCRRVHSADGLITNTGVRKLATDKNRSQPASIQLTPEEQRVIRNSTTQFQRRGGFVRIFPAADSWAKYSQYLDPTTGIPICGTPSSNYTLNFAHNFNQLLYNHFFPDVPPSPAKNVEKSSTNRLMCGDNGEY